MIKILINVSICFIGWGYLYPRNIQRKDLSMTNIKRTIVVAVSALLISSAALAQDNTTKQTSVLSHTNGIVMMSVHKFR